MCNVCALCCVLCVLRHVALCGADANMFSNTLRANDAAAFLHSPLSDHAAAKVGNVGRCQVISPVRCRRPNVICVLDSFRVSVLSVMLSCFALEC